MRRRFLPSRRTRSNITDTSQLRNEFIRQLGDEAQALIDRLSNDFSQDLQTQVTRAYQGIIAGDAPTLPSSANPQAGTIGSFGQLLSTGVRYLISRPRTSRSSNETVRSVDNNTQFRLSSAQLAAEAQQTLSRGEKNL